MNGRRHFLCGCLSSFSFDVHRCGHRFKSPLNRLFIPFFSRLFFWLFLPQTLELMIRQSVQQKRCSSFCFVLRTQLVGPKPMRARLHKKAADWKVINISTARHQTGQWSLCNFAIDRSTFVLVPVCAVAAACLML